MAVDEALLESVGAGKSGPVIRLYGFSPAALSFGRFQHIKDSILISNLIRDGVGYVRRPTGGHAVLHDEELTYSVILSRNHLIPFRKRTIYRFIGEILIKGLNNLGLNASINLNRTGELRNPDCFATKGEYEISSLSGKKLIGSAQMTTRQGVLQHGSIPIGPSYKRIGNYLKIDKTDFNTEPACIEEELKKSVSYEECRDAFLHAVQDMLPIEISELTGREIRRAEEISEKKYSKDSWNLLY
ncbi:MAG: lipoate--protein ligase family protein [Spirochaetes bacterium]|nr:lipoate--protein ligase family protein [Spirochaetota bacterium]